MIVGSVAMALLTSNFIEEKEYKYLYPSPYIAPSEIPYEMVSAVAGTVAPW